MQTQVRNVIATVLIALSDASFSPPVIAEPQQAPGQTSSVGREEFSEKQRYQMYEERVAAAEREYNNRSEAATWGKLQSMVLVSASRQTEGHGAFLRQFRDEFTSAIVGEAAPSKEQLQQLERKYDDAFWKQLHISKPEGRVSINVSGTTSSMELQVKDQNGNPLISTKDPQVLKFYGAKTACTGALSRLERKGGNALVLSWWQLDIKLGREIESAQRN